MILFKDQDPDGNKELKRYFIKGILIAIEVKLFFRFQYIVQYIGFISFIACPILAYRLLVISGLIS